MRILERPVTGTCHFELEDRSQCGAEFPIGTRGPIPQRCPEHRSLTSKTQKRLRPRVTLPRREIDELRQSRIDALRLQHAAQESLITVRRQLWRTKELLRDVRLENAELRNENGELGTTCAALREQVTKLEHLAGIPADDREGYEAMGELLRVEEPAVFVEVDDDDT